MRATLTRPTTQTPLGYANGIRHQLANLKNNVKHITQYVQGPKSIPALWGHDFERFDL
jgi:hypothetical protein